MALDNIQPVVMDPRIIPTVPLVGVGVEDKDLMDQAVVEEQGVLRAETKEELAVQVVEGVVEVHMEQAQAVEGEEVMRDAAEITVYIPVLRAAAARLALRGETQHLLL